MYLLVDCEFSININGCLIFKLPKLLFAFLICEKLSNPIRVFDVKEFLETNSMEDIRNKIFKYTDKACRINQKYYVKNKTDVYIDIPLLVEFFSYNFSTVLLAIPYQEISYTLTIPSNKIARISKYLEDIDLMFEELIYVENVYRRQLTQTPYNLLKMQTEMEYFHCWKGNVMKLTNDYYYTKFIFIVVRQHEATNLDLEIISQTDANIDVSQFPQIIEVELDTDNLVKDENTKVCVHIVLRNQYN